MTSFKLYAPLRLPKNKKGGMWGININTVRTTHFRVLAKMKVLYAEYMCEQVQELPCFTKVVMTLTLYPKTKRLCDLDNMLAYQSKFIQDTLVNAGKLPDDNYIYVPKIIYEFGSIDKTNPRVEIQIQEIT